MRGFESYKSTGFPHVVSVFADSQKSISHDWVEKEVLIEESILYSLGFVLDHIGLPHFEGFPLSELGEKFETLDLVIGLTLLEPIF